MILQNFRDSCNLFISLFLCWVSKIFLCRVFDVLSSHPISLQFDAKPKAVELFSKELPQCLAYFPVDKKHS
jgi:hypothetical protein